MLGQLADFAKLRQDVEKSYTLPGNLPIQEHVLKSCLDVLLLDKLISESHLFCDPDLEVITVHSLIVFSFPIRGDEARREEIKRRLFRSLRTCSNCVRHYHKGLSLIKRKFIMVRRVQPMMVAKFLDIFDTWQLQRLLEALSKPTSNSIETQHLLYECLSNPALIRKSRDFKVNLSKIVANALENNLYFDHLLPSIVTLIIEGDEIDNKYAHEYIRRLGVDAGGSGESSSSFIVDPQVSDEFFFQLYRIQNARYFTEDRSRRFWDASLALQNAFPPMEFTKLFLPPDIDIMSAQDDIRYYGLPRVCINNVLADLKSTMPILLMVFKNLLISLKEGFWNSVGDIPPSTVMDVILLSRNFQSLLVTSSLVDSLSWVLPFIESLAKNQKQALAAKAANFLADREVVSQDGRADSVNALNSCIADHPSSENLPMLKLRDLLLSISRNSAYFISFLREKDRSATVLELFRFAVESVVYTANQNSTALRKQQLPSFFERLDKFWGLLCNAHFSTESATAIMSALYGCENLISFKEKLTPFPTKELEAATKIHSRDSLALCTDISGVLEKFSLLDPDILHQVFTNQNCQRALWGVIFQPQLSQSALSIVTEMYDAQGRYEGFCSLFKDSLSSNLAAISSILQTLTELAIFEPIPRTIRILMDIWKALADPVDSILSTSDKSTDSLKSEVNQFWASSWALLVMVYKTTMAWASMYKVSDLLEFTRDTLDLSHLLLDSLRTLSGYLGEEAELFDPFLEAFRHVISWLRLGDLSLLSSCVTLVFKGFDLAKEMEQRIDPEFIVIFAKYGAKAKKFNSKLSENQRSDILAKAGELDPELVQTVIEDARVERETSGRSRVASPDPLAIAPSKVNQGASYAYESRVKKLTQLTLSRFGVLTKEAPVAPPPVQKHFKSNTMESIRNELKKTRTEVKPAAAPAPPRPAGFNLKSTTVVGRSLNQIRRTRNADNSLEEETSDVDVSDLFLDSKKKPKILEVDFEGKPIIKMAKAKKVDQARLEEERMRMRLTVNLKPLYSTILRWLYNNNEEFPSEDRSIYKKKQSTYNDVKEYIRMMEPLLMLECWQGIQATRVTGQENAFELLVGSRTTCDGFFDVFASIKRSDLQDRKIGDTDLVVLGYAADQNFKHGNEISKYLKASSTTTCLAKVQDIKFANQDYSDITLRVYPQGSMVGHLTPKLVVVGMKVMPMVTIEREFSSLKGLQYYDLCGDILKAKPADSTPVSETAAQRLCQSFGVNTSQAKAILGSHHNEGFSLIQGPPGTGKTKTILGIVGHFLSKQLTPETIIEVPGVTEVKTPGKGLKVLVCAPSNAAVDELVLRLKSGVLNDKGEQMNPKIVRLGRGDAINQAVRDVGLEELIEKALSGKIPEKIVDPQIRIDHNKCISERDQLREKLKNSELSESDVVALETQLRGVNKKRAELARKLDEQRESASIALRTRDFERRQAQAKILSEAQIVCSTLSGSAHDFLASMSMKFDLVIIDEACQCVELSAIIPLRYGCKKCIMVGDPNQLPPTVLSQKAASYKYEESLFVRMQQAHPESVYLLDVQYRMHPAISRFPSAQFYNNKLADGPSMREINTRPWHSEYPFTPYRFFDITSRHQQSELTRSFFNMQEAKVALELVEKLMSILPQNQFRGRVGVISPYKEQIRTLRDVFRRKYGQGIFSEIDFNTVDGFQGQEKEIIIMSCVRASETGSVGFLSDVRRMNVALTRARTTMWILGNKSSLRRDKVWNKLITDAEERKCVTVAEPGFLRRVTRPLSEKDEFPEDKTVSNGDDNLVIDSANCVEEAQEENSVNDSSKLPNGPRASTSIPKEKRASNPSIFADSMDSKRRKTAKKPKQPHVYQAQSKNTSKPNETHQSHANSSASTSSVAPTNTNSIKPQTSGTLQPRPPRPTNLGVFIQKRRKPPH